MNTLKRWSILAGSLLAIGLPIAGGLRATQADASSQSHRSGSVVAVLDVARIFDEHTRFKATMAQLKADMDRAEAHMREQSEPLRKLAEGLRKSSKDPKSAEYEAQQADIAKRSADLKVQVELQRKEFVKREAEAYHRVYQQILRAVEEYARQKQIDVVLRLHQRPVDVQKPDQVLQQINRDVVWTDPGLDITPIILPIVNQISGESNPGEASQPEAEKPATGSGEAAKDPAEAPSQGPSKPAPSKDEKRPRDEKGPPVPPKTAGAERPSSDGKGADKTDAVARQEKEAAGEPNATPPKDEPKAADHHAKAAAAVKPKPDPKATRPKTSTVVRLTFKGSYPEAPSSPGLFGDVRPSLATAVGRMDRAGKDDEVAAVLLRIQGASLGRGKLYELRAAVARLRKTGKPVYAELTGADTSQYLLASACDEVVLAPIGTLTIPGVRAEATFFKGLLDKIGIQFDVLQMGKYKGAAESFTRTGMSAPLRESMEALVDDTYEGLVATIANDRHLDAARVKKLIDQGIFTAKAAAQAGLVDHVAYPDEFRQTLSNKLGADAVKLVDDYGKAKRDTDFSGLAGMMKLMQLMFGGEPEAKTSKKQKIAVVYAVGVIVQGRSTTSIFGEQVLGSETLVKALRSAAEDPSVLAIVLRVDSPGGSAVASDLVWREVVKISKPIVASMGDVAGSGGYYIAMGADKILAAPDTITGSIGVVGGKFVLGGLYDKIGVSTEVISRGKNSGAFSSDEPFTPEQREAWMAVMKEVYEQFVSKAARARKMPGEKLEALAQGRVYTGRMAARNGLVDGLGTLREAIAEAKKAAGLKPDQDVELLILPRPRTIFEQLFQDAWLAGRLEAALPELKEMVPDVQLLRRVFSEPALALMPCWLELK